MSPPPKSSGPPLWVWALMLPLATLGLLGLYRDVAQPLLLSLIKHPDVDVVVATPAPAAAANPSSGLFGALDARRTWYDLDKHLPVPAGRVAQLVRHALQAAPSAFNSEPGRALVLLGAKHDRLWDAVAAAAARWAVVPAEQWEASSAAGKLAAHRAAAGTVLFFVDKRVVEKWAADVPAHAASFPRWAAESGGMLQLAVWAALAAEGVGANLQHFNGAVGEVVAEEEGWGVRPGWEATAQLVFGGRVGDTPPPKGKIPMGEKLVVRGEVV
ncbi:hypothetical protein RB594_000454 [Gaeumannomyces avenae]